MCPVKAWACMCEHTRLDRIFVIIVQWRVARAITQKEFQKGEKSKEGSLSPEKLLHSASE